MSNTAIMPAGGAEDRPQPKREPPRLVRVSRSKTIDIPLTKEQLVVGREDTCDLVIENDGQVSREHCGFRVYRDGAVTVTDFGSCNGTFVNDQRVYEETALSDGDRIRFGDKGTFTLKLPGTADAEDDAGADTEDAVAAAKPPPPRSKLERAAAELAEQLDERNYAAVMRDLVRKAAPGRTKRPDHDKPNEYW